MKILAFLSFIIMSFSVEAQVYFEDNTIPFIKHSKQSIVDESLIREDFERFKRFENVMDPLNRINFMKYPVELEFTKDQLICRDNGDLYRVNAMQNLFGRTHYRSQKQQYVRREKENSYRVYLYDADELFRRIDDDKHLKPIENATCK